MHQKPSFYQRYTLINKIGQGGFGKVYLAKDKLHQNQLVVVKVNKDVITNNHEYQIALKLNQMKLLRFPRIYKKGMVKN